MYKTASSILLFLIFPAIIFAQILPKDSSVLNYRIIGFTFPAEKRASSYQLEIATGDINNSEVFERNISKTISEKSNKIIAEVPAFSTHYTWRVVYTWADKKKKASSLYHFSTGSSMETDTSHYRLRITKDAGKYADACVFLDGHRVLYDMRGQPIWYMPAIEHNTSFNVRDIKVTNKGTITFMVDNIGIFEMTYSGKLLWQGPQNAHFGGHSDETYHHEFTRLPNGHFLVLSEQSIMWDTASYIRDEKSGSATSNTLQLTPFGSIIEYDDSGNVIWSWNSGDYFSRSDLLNYHLPDGVPFLDVYENAFYFDSKKQVIYVGFQGISRILKIKYPEGTVLNDYGEKFIKGTEPKGNDLFCGQNAIGLTQDRYLYLFNNTCQLGSMPTIELVDLATDSSNNLNKKWEYKYPDELVESNSINVLPKRGNKIQRPLGGNITEMADSELFVSLCIPYGMQFIVNRDKQLLWSASSERWLDQEKKWIQSFQYRPSIICSRKELEQLIWKDEEMK